MGCNRQFYNFLRWLLSWLAVGLVFLAIAIEYQLIGVIYAILCLALIYLGAWYDGHIAGAEIVTRLFIEDLSPDDALAGGLKQETKDLIMQALTNPTKQELANDVEYQRQLKEQREHGKRII